MRSDSRRRHGERDGRHRPLRPGAKTPLALFLFDPLNMKYDDGFTAFFAARMKSTFRSPQGQK